MFNKYKFEVDSVPNMTTSTVVTESTSYTRTTTMTYTGGQTRTEFQSTSSTTPGKSLLNSNISTVPNMLSTSSSLPSRSLQPFSREFRSAFNNQPRGIYNSFNGKTSVMPTTEKKSDEKEKKSGIFSIFKRSDKEKEDMKKAKEEAKAKKEREIAAKEEAKAKREREIAAKEKEKKEKAAREKEKEAKEKEEKENKKKAKKLKNKKDEKATSVTAYDAKLMNNGFSSNNRNYFGLQDRDEQLVIKVTKTDLGMVLKLTTII
ncbi:hypothetical protein QE152_g19677 [Popillia japonica]|uniref:Uncharacterized protein n=1 Tax=Popillia japonica TaxID=7064 RepID=A0AAW1KR96_POPJA